MSTRILATMALLLSVLSLSVWAESKDKDYAGTIAEFRKSDVVAPLFESAYGYAVFPTIGEGGFGIGAAHGKGLVYQGGKAIGETSTTDISIGFQAGGQAYSQVIFFEDKASLDKFTSGNFEFSAGAEAIAIQAKAEAKTSTEGTGVGANAKKGSGSGQQTNQGYTDGVLVFTVAKGGLMYQAVIAGQKYKYEAL
jgi:lipid-binding SYLF domain-containing protein